MATAATRHQPHTAIIDDQHLCSTLLYSVVRSSPLVSILLQWIRAIYKRQLYSGAAEPSSKDCLDHFLGFRSTFE